LSSLALVLPVLTTGIVVLGVVLVVAFAVRNTTSADRAEVIRAVGDLFRAVAEVIRWIWRCGPPGGVK
jgi:predicted membrane chloride channel (bestrophin family)